MRTTISLGRWFGVPIRLHFSWIIIAWLITVSLRWQLSAVNDSWSSASVWALSAITAALFFLCITLHELAHASVARSFGVPVHSITLFALGNGALINMIMASRLVYGMSEEGIVPGFFGRVLSGRRTPITAIVFTAMFGLPSWAMAPRHRPAWPRRGRTGHRRR